MKRIVLQINSTEDPDMKLVDSFPLGNNEKLSGVRTISHGEVHYYVKTEYDYLDKDQWAWVRETRGVLGAWVEEV